MSRALARRENTAGYLFMLPSLVFFIGFVVIPMVICLITIVLSVIIYFKDRRSEKTYRTVSVLVFVAYFFAVIMSTSNTTYPYYIPFLIMDMVIASVLLAMGMMMLPPMMVAMPFKLLLFVMVDCWNLLIGSLVNSFLL